MGSTMRKTYCKDGLILVDDSLYVVSGQGHLACIDSNRGEVLWKFDAYKKFESSWKNKGSIIAANNKHFPPNRKRLASLVPFSNPQWYTLC